MQLVAVTVFCGGTASAVLAALITGSVAARRRRLEFEAREDLREKEYIKEHPGMPVPPRCRLVHG